MDLEARAFLVNLVGQPDLRVNVLAEAPRRPQSPERWPVFVSRVRQLLVAPGQVHGGRARRRPRAVWAWPGGGSRRRGAQDACGVEAPRQLRRLAVGPRMDADRVRPGLVGVTDGDLDPHCFVVAQDEW